MMLRVSIQQIMGIHERTETTRGSIILRHTHQQFFQEMVCFGVEGGWSKWCSFMLCWPSWIQCTWVSTLVYCIVAAPFSFLLTGTHMYIVKPIPASLLTSTPNLELLMAEVSKIIFNESFLMRWRLSRGFLVRIIGNPKLDFVASPHPIGCHYIDRCIKWYR